MTKNDMKKAQIEDEEADADLTVVDDDDKKKKKKKDKEDISDLENDVIIEYNDKSKEFVLSKRIGK